MTQTLRKLTSSEVCNLRSQGCSAQDWGQVEVPADLGVVPADRFRNVHFSGAVRLGHFTGTTDLPGGVHRPTGLYHATLHNCALGDDVTVYRVGSCIANVDIGARAILEDVDLLTTEAETAFGNGVEVRTVNEAGGREVLIYDRLTAQIAYLQCFYRDRPELIERLRTLIAAEVERVRSSRGTIGPGARITNSGALIDVRVGPGARIKGVVRLRNGTVNSTAEAPTYVGDGVLAEDFIIGSGSRIDGGVVLARCYVSQGVTMDKQFAAENSLFFANTDVMLGEACAVFAGPFTVSHHKSSLLLTALYSFYNAGSGSNFSNHMYKLGPVHQGVLERGCKTGSFSHIYWPSRVGAFSVIIGRHHHHVDTSDLPFSYLIEKDGQTLVVPGANLNTCGTRRDSEKWPDRDRRADPDRLDLVQTAVINPYTAQQMQDGMAFLAQTEAATGSTEQLVAVRGVRLTRSRLRTGQTIYTAALQRYTGDVLVPLLQEAIAAAPQAEWVARVLGASAARPTRWRDLAGCLLPADAVETILSGICGGDLDEIAAVETALRREHAAYSAHERDWVRAHWLARLDKPPAAVTTADLARMVADWRDAVATGNHAILHDAAKEFEPSVRVSFGIDGAAAAREADFEAVRGTCATTPLVQALRREIDAVDRAAADLLDALQKGTP